MCKCIASEISDCKEPNNYRKIQRNLSRVIERDYYQNLGSLSFPANYKQATEQTEKGKRMSALRTKIYGQSLNCTEEMLKIQNGISVRQTLDKVYPNRSVCPWDIVAEYDPLRIPATVAKARCSCQNCLSKDLLNSRSYGCVTVDSAIPVIRKECVNMTYTYQVELETVPVGCSCQKLNDQRKTPHSSQLD